jgi:hypothetical protein
MDELINSYITDNFSDELKSVIFESFKIFNDFDMNDIYSPFIDILTDSSNMSKEDVYDLFIHKLHEAQNYIFEQTKITLNDDVSLSDKNKLLIAINLLVDLEDYTPVITTLESNLDNNEKIASILADLSDLTVDYVLTLIDDIKQEALDELKAFIYEKENTLINKEIDLTEILNTFRIFVKINGEANLGSLLIKNDISIGEDMSVYLEYIKDSIVNPKDEQTALNIVSLIYLTKCGYTKPLETFKEHSLDILDTLTTVSRIEPFVTKLIGEVEEYKLAEKNKSTS